MTDQELKDMVADLVKSTAGLEADLRRTQQDTARQIKQTTKQLGELGNKFGSFAEGMALPSMEKLLYEQFGMDAVFPRAKAKKNGRMLEIDVLAYDNGARNEAYIVEVKSHLKQEGVEQILKTIADFPKFFPTLAGRTVYGIVAAVDIPEGMKNAVLKQGLYLAHISGETFKLQVPRNFQPKAFNVNGMHKNGHKTAKKKAK